MIKFDKRYKLNFTLTEVNILMNVTYEQWYERLGYVNFKILRHIVTNLSVQNLKIDSVIKDIFCNIYINTI